MSVLGAISRHWCGMLIVGFIVVAMKVVGAQDLSFVEFVMAAFELRTFALIAALALPLPSLCLS